MKEQKDDHLYPSKFTVNKFKFWQISMENFLDSKQGIGGMPLSYIIHEDGLDLDDAVDEHERAIWLAPLAGANFDEDNLTIYYYYKDRVIDTPAWTWFNTAANGDGRAAALAIRDHYVGPAAVNYHVAETEAKLDHLNWSNEVQFPFDTYISHMSECFQDLEEQDEHILECAKVN